MGLCNLHTSTTRKEDGEQQIGDYLQQIKDYWILDPLLQLLQ